MNISGKVFRKYIEQYTSQNTRANLDDYHVLDLEVEDGLITSVVEESHVTYEVEIEYTNKKVAYALCFCGFRQGPICPHIVVTIIAADALLTGSEEEDAAYAGSYLIPGKNIADLTNADLFKHATRQGVARMNYGRNTVFPSKLAIDKGTFLCAPGVYREYPVTIKQNAAGIHATCGCWESKRKLCEHQTVVLVQILEMKAYRVFFDRGLRSEFLLEKAAEYGLEQEKNPHAYFKLELNSGAVKASPLIPALLPLNEKTKEKLEKQLIPKRFVPGETITAGARKNFVLIGAPAYSKSFYLKLYEAPETKDGRIKNPLRARNPLDHMLKTDSPEELKFYAALARFQQEYRVPQAIPDLDPNDFAEELKGIKSVLANPGKLTFYRHDADITDNITAASVVPVSFDTNGIDLSLEVKQNGVFYEVTGKIEALNTEIPFDRVKWVYRYFVQLGSVLLLIDNLDFLRTIEFLKQHNNKLVIHSSKFEEFRHDFLAKLESKVKISYSFIKPASLKVIEQTGLNKINERIIYLSDSGDYVLITPVIRYGDTEIPLLSQRQLYTLDQTGTAYAIERNKKEELNMLINIMRLSDLFEEQMGNEFFYLHKSRFLDDGWFLDAFELWNSLGYVILGFSDLKNNVLNPNKMKVVMQVKSEIDWFDTTAKVNFGDQEVRLRDIRKSVVNKNRFVKLGDGTMGLLPDEWLNRFSHYFRNGEIVGDSIRTPKSNYALIDELYEDEVLTKEAREEIAFYKEKVREFERIGTVEPPAGLNATLRDYQKEGLNWLCFLDEFGFGGCLADDMGLGKTVQIIAFILKQREKQSFNTNLVVVPTSLIFNWQQEVQKFAPSIKMLVIHGNGRVKSTAGFEDYEIILTSYGTLLSDATFLRKFRFNYIFLDESQAIKNPESKRYKSVRLLQSRNKIVMTGTPVENNTFDLYAQLSFAVPGLLGSVKRFRDDYAMPIDKFKDSRRAKELQRKINPFLLRRTKNQVAQELPEKTEMVVYCEMGAEQRRVYDTYKKEFQLYLQDQQHDDLKDGTMHILQGLTKLRQICNSPALLSDDEFYGDESAKIDELVAQIESKAANHKILVFSQFVGMLDLIGKELDKRKITYARLTGKTKNRQEEVEKFQSREDVRVFLISLKAGGTGLNLTEADYVYIVDPWWNPAVENQAIDRCYRIGQQKKVMAIRLICPDTIEEKILRLQETKKDLVSDLIHTDTSVLKSLSRTELLGLFD